MHVQDCIYYLRGSFTGAKGFYGGNPPEIITKSFYAYCKFQLVLILVFVLFFGLSL